MPAQAGYHREIRGSRVIGQIMGAATDFISASAAVRAWEETVTIPTYEPLPPERCPMFLDRRVYQGSSGKVYPLPCVDRILYERDPLWKRIGVPPNRRLAELERHPALLAQLL
jgi:hypothetical protein